MISEQEKRGKYPKKGKEETKSALLAAILGKVAVADGEGRMPVEQRAVVTTRGRAHMAERMLGFEEELKVVGAGIADLGSFADHAQDIGLIQEGGVHCRAHFV